MHLINLIFEKKYSILRNKFIFQKQYTKFSRLKTINKCTGILLLIVRFQKFKNKKLDAYKNHTLL